MEGLQVKAAILTTTPMTINLRVLVIIKFYGSYYEFMEKFYALVVHILMENVAHRLL